MSENSASQSRVESVPGVATLIIPDQLADQLVAYLETLETDDAETSGYMRNFGLSMGVGMRVLAEQTQTVTNCKDTKGGADHLCDADVWIEGS